MDYHINRDIAVSYCWSNDEILQLLFCYIKSNRFSYKSCKRTESCKSTFKIPDICIYILADVFKYFLIYLITFKFGYFKAVIRAHRDYRRSVREVSGEEIERYLIEKGKIAGVAGMYPGWIVPKALIYRKDIFKMIRSGI